MYVVSVAVMAEEKLPLEYFVKNSDYRQVLISPDGKYFAARIESEGQTVLAFIRRQDMQVTGGTRPRRDGNINGMSWLNNERLGYTMSMDYGYLDQQLSTGEYYAVNRDGSKNETIFSDRAGFSIISTLPEEEDYVLIAVYPWTRGISRSQRSVGRNTEVDKLDIKYGRRQKKMTMPLKNSLPVADKHGFVHFVYSNDLAGNVQVSRRSPQNEEWSTFDIDIGDATDLRPISVDIDRGVTYFWGNQGDKQTAALFELDNETNQLKVVHSNDDIDVHSFHWDHWSRVPAVLESHRGTVEYEYVGDSTVTQLHKMLANAFSGQEVVVTSSTADEKEFLVFVSSDVNPGEYYLFNGETNKARFLMATRSWVDAKKMRPMKPVHFDNREGVRIHGYLTTPAGEGPHPLIVLPHGGPHGIRDYWRYDWEVQLLAHYGYSVLQVNYQGSGGYGELFETAGYGEWGGKMQDDVTDATHWAIEKGYAERDNICIYGASYGAYAAMMGVIREPDLYQCAVGYAGVYDLNRLIEDGEIKFFRGGDEYVEKVFGTDEADIRDRSTTTHAAKIKVPLFLAHGGEDFVAPIEQAEAMTEALDDAGKSYEWLEFKREGHGFADIEHRKEFYTRLLKFFGENLRQPG
ncbi:MAG: S9 family peptidase [Wenzhouxiangellaceae bacterium]